MMGQCYTLVPLPSVLLWLASSQTFSSLSLGFPGWQLFGYQKHLGPSDRSFSVNFFVLEWEKTECTTAGEVPGISDEQRQLVKAQTVPVECVVYLLRLWKGKCHRFWYNVLNPLLITLLISLGRKPGDIKNHNAGMCLCCSRFRCVTVGKLRSVPWWGERCSLSIFTRFTQFILFECWVKERNGAVMWNHLSASCFGKISQYILRLK